MTVNSDAAYRSAPADFARLTASWAAFFSASGGEAQPKTSRLAAASRGRISRGRRTFIGCALLSRVRDERVNVFGKSIPRVAPGVTRRRGENSTPRSESSRNVDSTSATWKYKAQPLG